MMGWFDGFADFEWFDGFNEFWWFLYDCRMRDESRWRVTAWWNAVCHIPITDRIANSIFSGYGGISNGNWTNNMPICLYFREKFPDEKPPDLTPFWKSLRNWEIFRMIHRLPIPLVESATLCKHTIQIERLLIIMFWVSRRGTCRKRQGAFEGCFRKYPLNLDSFGNSYLLRDVIAESGQKFERGEVER